MVCDGVLRYQFFEQIFSDYWKACSSRACLFVCSSFIVSVESDLLVFIWYRELGYQGGNRLGLIKVVID